MMQNGQPLQVRPLDTLDALTCGGSPISTLHLYTRAIGLVQSSRCVPGVQVPALFDKEEVRDRLKRLPGGPTQPLTIHLRQEIDRLNIIVRLTTSTLQNLRLAIAGTIALSGGLIEALDALFMARIPAAWLKKSWEVGPGKCGCVYLPLAVRHKTEPEKPCIKHHSY